MAKESPRQEGDGAPVRKHRRLRRIIGIALLILTVVFALHNTVVMRQQIETAEEAAKPLLQRALQNNLIVAVAFAVFSIGLAFDVLANVRSKAVRIISYGIWGLSILVAAEAVLLCGVTAVKDLNRDTAPDAQYILVLGKALNEDKSIPGDLSQRLNAAADLQKRHPEKTVIVTGDGRVSNSQHAGSMGGEVDYIAAVVTNRGVPKEAVLEIGRSDSDEKSFENLLKKDEINEDTPITVIVDQFDMGRTLKTAEAAGFTAVSSYAAAPGFWEVGDVLLWRAWNAYDPAMKPAE